MKKEHYWKLSIDTKNKTQRDAIKDIYGKYDFYHEEDLGDGNWHIRILLKSKTRLGGKICGNFIKKCVECLLNNN